MKSCDGCRFCCWSFGISELDKKALLHCENECQKGCSIYKTDIYPQSCNGFTCPYLLIENLYRPDEFQSLLESLKGDLGSYIPVVPKTVPLEEAKALIKKTRTIMAGIVNTQISEASWMFTVIPLDRMKEGGWATGSILYDPWKELCDKSGAEFYPQHLHPWFTIVA